MKKVDTTKTFEDMLKTFLQVRHCFLTSSGTAALHLALITLKELSPKDEVILPAYTCPSILAAVIKADLKPVLCDLAEEKTTFNYHELKAKISDHTLAIISVHLFGIPEDLYKINHLTSSHKIFHIEDAAQSFGTTSNHQKLRPQAMLGTLGDIGIFSFGRGKPLPLMQGGALATNSDNIAKILLHKLNELEAQNTMETFIAIIKVLLYSLFLHPRLYWLPQHAPLLHLGETIFNLDFSTKKIDSFTSALGMVMIASIAKLSMLRAKKEHLLADNLLGFRDYFLSKGKHKLFLLRFPLLMRSKQQKELVLSELKLKGIGASGMYPSSLNHFQDTKKYFNPNHQCKNAQAFSDKILTLPLHEFITEKDVKKIKNTLAKYVQQDLKD